MENEVGLVRLGAEVHRAQADAADGEAGAAEVGVAHGADPNGRKERADPISGCFETAARLRTRFPTRAWGQDGATDPAGRLPGAGGRPAPGGQRVHLVRRPLLRPAQRLRVLRGHRVHEGRRRHEGEVRTFTIVSFAAPGIPVPFVAAVVDCEGTSVRANLINVTPDPEHVSTGHEGAPGHRGRSARTTKAPKPSASASNPWEVEHDGIGIRGAVDPRDPHDQVRQAPRQGHRRPGRRGGARARWPTAA